jgi:hypothetical protein
VEECFILDVNKARMVQEVGVHKATGFVVDCYSLGYFCLSSFPHGTIGITFQSLTGGQRSRSLVWRVILVLTRCQVDVFFIKFFFFSPGDSILACLLLKLAFHEDVEEVTDSSVVTKFSANIDSLEEGMAISIFYVFKRY